MNANLRRAAWRCLQEELAVCDRCRAMAPRAVAEVLGSRELPDPPDEIRVLFVGVAPTPIQGHSRGQHFYSSATDLLRVGLFRVLDEQLGTRLAQVNARGLEEGNAAFHAAGFFFVHTAKIRPIHASAPPPNVTAECASRHLAFEIPLLAPQAVCFLGTNNTSKPAEILFGRPISAQPIHASLGGWRGQVAVAHQPRRGHQAQTAAVVRTLFSGTGCD